MEPEVLDQIKAIMAMMQELVDSVEAPEEETPEEETPVVEESVKTFDKSILDNIINKIRE